MDDAVGLATSTLSQQVAAQRSAFLEEAALTSDDVADVWTAHARDIVRLLDLDLLGAWAEATMPYVLEHATNKLQPIRFLEHISGVAGREVEHWRADGMQVQAAAPVRTVPESHFALPFEAIFLDEASAALRHDRLHLVEEDRTAHWDLPVLSDVRAEQMATLGWRDDVVVWAHDISWLTLPDVQFVTYREDPRGGIIFGGDSYHADLTFSEFLLDLLQHYVATPGERREPFAVALTSTCPTAFYHELIDTLGSLAHLPPDLRDAPLIAPVVFEPLLPLYEAAGVQPGQLRSYAEVRSVTFDRVIAPVLTPPSRRKMTFLRELGLKLPAKRPGASADKVYISRSRATARALRNELAVEAVFAAAGFTIAHFEDLDVTSQVALMRDARIIAAPHGAGLANAAFAAPGTVVIELVPPWYPASIFFNQAYGCGHPYLPLIGTDSSAASDLSWEMDVSLVRHVLGELAHAGVV